MSQTYRCVRFLTRLREIPILAELELGMNGQNRTLGLSMCAVLPSPSVVPSEQEEH